MLSNFIVTTYGRIIEVFRGKAVELSPADVKAEEARWRVIVRDLEQLIRDHPSRSPETYVYLLQEQWLLSTQDREDLLDYIIVTRS